MASFFGCVPPLQHTHINIYTSCSRLISHVFFSCVRFSDDALEPLLALVKDTKVDPADLVRRLKKNIQMAVLQDFESMWKTQNFDIQLGVLEKAKKVYQGGDKAWYVCV